MKTVQWVHSKLVPAETILSLNGPNPFTWCSEVFPYTVPAGYWLGITDAQVGSKFTHSGRSSFLVIHNVLSLPDMCGSVHYRIPLVIKPGVTISADLINNSYTEAQWMTSSITGILKPQVAGETWQDAFTYLVE